MNKAKYRLAIAAVSLFLVGIMFGGLIQAYRIPRNIIERCQFIHATYFQSNDNIDTEESITITTRKCRPPAGTEENSCYIYRSRSLELSKTALVIIDARTYTYYITEGWTKRAKENMRLKLAPLLWLAREHNILIIHAPYGYEIAEVAKPLPGEFVLDSSNHIDDTTELDSYLQARGITTLLFAGYASHSCLLFKPTGIQKMRELGYEIILVRDCTIAQETHESLAGEWANRMAIYMVECQWGETTTLEDLAVALEEYQSN